ncbi:hypothetical protein ACLI09_01180 [Flavobacterium sp. RHBU_24]|uniref:hypothetical protein n=1 Tax=Flavobacterium sp. RHBU_24 TaxID=3391185 RepID=UPI003984909C
MSNVKETEKEFRDKIVAGLHLAFERLVEQKRKTDSVLVVKRGGKIVHLKPDEL